MKKKKKKKNKKRKYAKNVNFSDLFGVHKNE